MNPEKNSSVRARTSIVPLWIVLICFAGLCLMQIAWSAEVRHHMSVLSGNQIKVYNVLKEADLWAYYGDEDVNHQLSTRGGVVAPVVSRDVHTASKSLSPPGCERCGKYHISSLKGPISRLCAECRGILE